MAYNPSIKALTSIMATARATTGTVIDAGGNIATVAADTARIDYSDGQAALLVEDARTNLVPYSAAKIADWLNDGATLTDLALSALGVFPGLRVASAGQSYNRASTKNVTWTAGTVYAVSAWYKSGTSGRCRVVVQDYVGAIESSVSGLAGALAVLSSAGGAVSNIVNTDLGGGLYKVTFLFTPNTSTTTGRPAIGPDVTTVGADVVALGVQVEAGGSPTSYIPTNGTAVTRAADLCTVDVSALGISAELTIGLKGNVYGYTTSYDSILTLDAGSHLDRISYFYDQGAGFLKSVAKVGGVDIISSGGSAPYTPGTEFSMAFRINATETRAAFNGALKTSYSASSAYTPPSIMRIGRQAGGSQTPRMRVKSLLLYPAALSDAALTALGTV